MHDVSVQLETIVRDVLPILRSVTEASAAVAPEPDVWSAKQVIGHLIDSASNNHQRFVRAQFSDELVFPGYDQETWVRVQAYQQAEWGALLALWTAYNLHLARIIALIPSEVRLRPRSRHNLDQLAWIPVPAGTPATLEYFMDDYVGHLKLHLRQIFNVLGMPAPAAVTETPAD